jgi:adenine-specific DNA-methyltransferase
MSLSISYMGTKRHLAPTVQRLARECKAGPMLDVFSGMCAIGRAVAPARQVWSNDLQYFASEVARALFCDDSAGAHSKKILENISKHYSDLYRQNCLIYHQRLLDENFAIINKDIYKSDEIFLYSIHRAQNSTITRGCSSQYSLFLERFSGSYFGYRQALEADCIFGAINLSFDMGELSAGERRWALIALGAALSKVSTTTGHFAQPLRPKPANSGKFFSQRSRSVWSEWVTNLAETKAVGCKDWRSRNFAFRSDAIDLLHDLRSASSRPGVVYADPPYTRDQYSRYYHVLETVLLYDFPACSGTGLYRDDRAVSAFSQSAKIEEALDDLIKTTRLLEADLILSYPSDGLLAASEAVIPAMIKSHYGRAPEIYELAHNHSTMGASKGDAKRAVREMLYKVSV